MHVEVKSDVGFLRPEPAYDICYAVIEREPLIVLMPSDHRLVARAAIGPVDDENWFTRRDEPLPGARE
jgi:LysR family hca operon transcriptional activator